MKVLVAGCTSRLALSAALSLAGVECQYLIKAVKQTKYNDNMKEVRGHCYPWYKKVK